MFLKVQCENCKTKYKLDGSRIQGKGARITCPKCRHVFVLMKDSATVLDSDDDESDASDQATVHAGMTFAPRAPDASRNLSTAAPPVAAPTMPSAVPASAPKVPAKPVVVEPALPQVDRPASVDGLNWKEVGLTTFKVKVAIGLVYDFSDVATLKKYISEKRVASTDRVSFDGKSWTTLKEIGNLDDFFIEQWVVLKKTRLQEDGKKPVEAAKGPSGPKIEMKSGKSQAERDPSGGRVPAKSANLFSGSVSDAFTADDLNRAGGTDLFPNVSEGAAPSVNIRVDGRPSNKPTALGGSGGRAEKNPPNTLAGSSTIANKSVDAALAEQKVVSRSLLGRFEIATLVILSCVALYMAWLYTTERREISPKSQSVLRALGDGLEDLMERNFPAAYAASQGKALPTYAEVPVMEPSAPVEATPTDVTPPAIEAPDRASSGRSGEGTRTSTKNVVVKESVTRAGSETSVSVGSITAEDLFNLGQASLQSRDYDAAIGSLQSAVDMKPTNDNYRYVLGLALLQSGRTGEAEQAFKRASRSRVDAHKWLGEIYARQGKTQNAVEAYNKYLEGAPEDADVIRAKMEKLSSP